MEQQERLTEFVEATREMRRLQHMWFGGDRSHATLIAAKNAEKRVDELLKRLDADFMVGQERMQI